MFTNCLSPFNYRRGRWTPHTPLGEGGVGFRGRAACQWYSSIICVKSITKSQLKKIYSLAIMGRTTKCCQWDLAALGNSCVMLKCKGQEGHPHCCGGHHFSAPAAGAPAGGKAHEQRLAIWTAPRFPASRCDELWN